MTGIMTAMQSKAMRLQITTEMMDTMVMKRMNTMTVLNKVTTAMMEVITRFCLTRNMMQSHMQGPVRQRNGKIYLIKNLIHVNQIDRDIFDCYSINASLLPPEALPQK